MFSVLSNTRNTNLNVAIGIAITIIVVFAFLAAPAIVAPKPAAIPVTGNQDAYFEHILGEKVIYANSVELNDALTAYHLGEKETIYAYPSQPQFDECIDVSLSELMSCRNEAKESNP